MGGSRNEEEADGCRLLAARAACAAAATATGISAFAALPEPPRHRPGFTGAVGTVVQFQESSGGGILYREEMGGMILPVSPAVAGSGRVALPPLEPRPAPPPGPPAARAAAASPPAGGAPVKR